LAGWDLMAFPKQVWSYRAYKLIDTYLTRKLWYTAPQRISASKTQCS